MANGPATKSGGSFRMLDIRQKFSRTAMGVGRVAFKEWSSLKSSTLIRYALFKEYDMFQCAGIWSREDLGPSRFHFATLACMGYTPGC